MAAATAEATVRRRGRARRPPVPLPLALLLSGVGALPLLWDPRFYFRGDTQIAYLGWWYHLGERVRQGDLPLMEPLAWEAGNYVAEGQWGLFSPLTILVGVLLTTAPDIVVFVTVLKIALLVVSGVGTYVLVRGYGAREGFAVIAGVVVGLSGEAVFVDWPSWVHNQTGYSLLPWAWWATRRAMAGRNPAAALALCYLVVAVGYVYCAMYVAAMLLGCLVDAVLARSRRQGLTVLGLSVVSGLVTVAVYLPGVLTAPVTVRSGWTVTGPGRLTMDLEHLTSSMVPTLRGHYLLWLLPAVAWLDLRRLGRVGRELAGATITGVVLLLWVLGPTAIGPLRWPMRVAPALMVALVVVFAVAASRCLLTPVPPARLVLSLAWTAVAAYVLLARRPHLVQEVAAGVLVVTLALATTAWSLRRPAHRLTTGVAVAWTVAVLVLQLALNPVPPAADRHLPAAPADYRGRIPTASGDVMVLGNPEGRAILDPAVARELHVGSAWHLDDKAVQNGYTTINFRRFRERFCRTFNGGTCARALDSLLSTEPTTGRRWVDLLSVSTLVFFRPTFPAQTDLTTPPRGWRVSGTTRHTVVWTRVERLPTAGGVVATSPGTGVMQEAVGDREVRLRVASVGPRGGTVTLSRLAWPGYTVEGGRLAEPVGGMLVQVALPPGSAGSTVTLRWDPPGWTLELASLWAAVLGGTLWAAMAWLGSRRLRGLARRRPAGARPPDVDGVRSAAEGRDDPPGSRVSRRG